MVAEPTARTAGHGRRVGSRNLDGVVNGFEYQTALRDGRFRDFLRDAGATYFVQHGFWNNPKVNSGDYDTFTFNSFSHLYNVTGGDIHLRRSDEVYRSRPYGSGRYRSVLVIWRLKFD